MSDSASHDIFRAPEIAQLAPFFPGYEIEGLIATGGMGAVYCAVQKSLDRTVAIKILPHEFSNDAAFCAGFEAEAKAMARLNHPNLIGVYDFGEVNGMLYIVMEFVPGQSLFHSSNGIAIDPGEVIRLVTGICEGLAHAHEHGILHRDIKPSNILLDLNAQPKIGDFGLARPVETKVREGEEIFGTPHYTAPEVVSSPHTVDYRADIFSVGVILHELLTGRLPADDPRSASAIVHCDPRFDAIIRRATYPQPVGRYHSALEIIRELQAIASSAGPRVLRTNSPKSPPRPRVGRVRPVTTKGSSSKIPGIIILILAITAIVISYNFFSNKQDPPPQKTHDGLATSENPQEMAKPPTSRSSLLPDSPPQIDPEPQPAPEPEPGPETTTSEPAPETMTSEQEPAPISKLEPEDSTKPQFAVPIFFERARSIMRDRSVPLIAKRDENLAQNLINFGKALKRLTRKINSRDKKNITEEIIEEFLEECRQNGNLIPEELGEVYKDVKELKLLHMEFFQNQKLLKNSLNTELFQLAGTYTLGLEKQIERLDPEIDASAIALIREEIEQVRTENGYFAELMLGSDSATDASQP